MPIMCGKEAHFQFFFFCEGCAKSGQDIETVFFCSECQKRKRNQHRHCTDDLMLVSSEEFKQALTTLKTGIHEATESTRQKFERQKNPQNFSEILGNLKKDKNLLMLKLIDDKERLSSLLLNEDMVNWLMEIKFWQGRNKTKFVQFQSKISQGVEKRMTEANKLIFEVIKHVQNPVEKVDEFNVEWKKNSVGEMLQKEIESLTVENAYMKKEADICNLVIKLFTSFTSQQLHATECECMDLLLKYPQSKVLYLSRIRINELLSRGNLQIPHILSEIKVKIDPNFDSTDIYHYYMAMSHWQMIDKEEKGEESIFFELKNKKYYRLIDVDGYILSLSKAIAVRQKPAYYISLGIGYIVKENHQEAVNVFKQASSMLTKRNDALDLNKFWAQIKFGGDELQFDSIMDNLETRTLQFITNISKYFKTSKDYSQLVECCEELISREPERSNFKIQFIKSILSYSSVVNEFNQDDNERLSRAEKMIFELKRAEEKEASKLQKRLTRVKAQNEFKNSNFMKASQGFQTLTKSKKLTSGSDYYNYAATQFKLFMDQQCTDELSIKQAYESIRQALQMKPNKIKYKKLKFFVCSYMNLFNEAYHTYEELKKDCPNQINEVEYERLIDFVRDNMEVETPGM